MPQQHTYRTDKNTTKHPTASYIRKQEIDQINSVIRNHKSRENTSIRTVS